MRRRVVTGALGAALVCLLALAAGLQVGPVRYPHRAPTVLDPGREGDWDGLGQAPAGDLAGDREWLAGVVPLVPSPRRAEDGSDTVWQASARDVTVRFAGDVGRERVAVLRVGYRRGMLVSPSDVVLRGEAGASPRQMRYVGGGPPQRVRAVATGGGDVDGMLLVLAPEGSTVTASAPLDVDPSGTVFTPTLAATRLAPTAWVLGPSAGTIGYRVKGPVAVATAPDAGGASGDPADLAILRRTAAPTCATDDWIDVEALLRLDALTTSWFSADGTRLAWCGGAPGGRQAALTQRAPSGGTVVLVVGQPRGDQTRSTAIGVTTRPAAEFDQPMITSADETGGSRLLVPPIPDGSDVALRLEP